MTTLNELKTKYQEAQAAQQRAHEAKQQALEDHRQEVLAEVFPQVVEYLSHREGVDPAELIQYGHIEGDWYSSGELNYVRFHLELPEHAPVSIRLYMKSLAENGRAEWVADHYNSYDELAPALIRASWLYQQQKADELRQQEQGAKDQQKKADKAAEAERQDEIKQQLFYQIASDPMALLLVKLFAQIQRERNGWNEQIERLEEANANAEYYHGEAMARVQRKAEEAQREATEASDRVRSIQYEVDDLDAKLKKSQRQGCW